MSPRPPNGKSVAARQLAAVREQIEDFEKHAKYFPEDCCDYMLEVFRILRTTLERPSAAATSRHKRGPRADLSLAVACQRVRDEAAGITVANTAERMNLSPRHVLQAVKRHSVVAHLLWRLDQNDLKNDEKRAAPPSGAPARPVATMSELITGAELER